MGVRNRYNAAGALPDRKDGGETDFDPIDKQNTKRVRASIDYWLDYTPSGTALPLGPCAAILIDTAAATLAGKPGDDPTGATTTIPYAAGIWHHVSYAVISAISSGKVYIGYHRKPTT